MAVLQRKVEWKSVVMEHGLLFVMTTAWDTTEVTVVCQQLR